MTAARRTCWRRWTPTPRGPGQRQAPGAPQEVPAFAPLLAPLHRTGVMVTADTLPTHRGRRVPDHLQAGPPPGHHEGQPARLLERCARLPGTATRPPTHPRPRPRPRRAPQPHRRQRPPPRVPHTAQSSRPPTTARPTHQPVPDHDRLCQRQPGVRADPPAWPTCCAALTIDALGQLRDVTLAEDASQVRAGAAPPSWQSGRTWSSGAQPGRAAQPRRHPTPATLPTPGDPGDLGISLR